MRQPGRQCTSCDASSLWRPQTSDEGGIPPCISAGPSCVLPLLTVIGRAALTTECPQRKASPPAPAGSTQSNRVKRERVELRSTKPALSSSPDLHVQSSDLHAHWVQARPKSFEPKTSRDLSVNVAGLHGHGYFVRLQRDSAVER